MANLLGGAFSAIAHKAIIRVECIGNGLLKNAFIGKSFGDFKVINGETDIYEFYLSQYRAGSSDGYVFEVNLPKIPSDTSE
jgi:hypothetical protein